MSNTSLSFEASKNAREEGVGKGKHRKSTNLNVSKPELEPTSSSWKSPFQLRDYFRHRPESSDNIGNFFNINELNLEVRSSSNRR